MNVKKSAAPAEPRIQGRRQPRRTAHRMATAKAQTCNTKATTKVIGNIVWTHGGSVARRRSEVSPSIAYLVIGTAVQGLKPDPEPTNTNRGRGDDSAPPASFVRCGRTYLVKAGVSDGNSDLSS